jgi:hypothetical protein
MRIEDTLTGDLTDQPGTGAPRFVGFANLDEPSAAVADLRRHLRPVVDSYRVVRSGR